MKRTDRFTLTLFCVISILLAGCSRLQQHQRVARTLSAFMKSPLFLPDTAIQVLSGSSDTIALPQSVSGHTMVVYYGPHDCSSCVISHLDKLEELFIWSEELNSFNVLLLFSPRREKINEVIDLLSVLNWSRPVYIDFKGQMKNNVKIPEEERFHEFLLDKNMRPVFVGNPLYSKKMKETFLEAINY